jgi:hypothetical protein
MATKRLYRKKINHISDTRKFFKKWHPKLRDSDIIWIMRKFSFYVAKALAHGTPITIRNNYKLSLYHFSSDEYERIEKEAMYARSPAIHGIFFGIHCEGFLVDKYKVIFKPNKELRNNLSNELSDPDLVYKLVAL